MKRLQFLILAVCTVLLFSCEGSDVYRGEWKAVDTDNEKLTLSFEAKSFSISYPDGELEKRDYTQNQVSIENGVKTFGIKSEGRTFKLHFPISGDESKGTFQDENGKIIYTIGRTDYITYDDLYGI